MGLHKGKNVSARTATKVWNKRVLCNKGVQLNTSTEQQRRATQHKHRTTSVQLNTSTAQQVCSARKALLRLPLHTEVQLLVRFLLAQSEFDIFNLLTECSIRGKLALDFLTTVEDGGMVTPTQFTTYLRQRHIRKLLT